MILNNLDAIQLAQSKVIFDQLVKLFTEKYSTQNDFFEYKDSPLYSTSLKQKTRNTKLEVESSHQTIDDLNAVNDNYKMEQILNH